VVALGSVGSTGSVGSSVHSPVDYHHYVAGEFGGMKIGTGNRKYLEKTHPSATLSTTNPT
jgi:hypothetical protein